MGLEPMTSSLPRKCSTTELQKPKKNKRNRAGDENRTHMASLEGWNFTTKLHPQKIHYIEKGNFLSHFDLRIKSLRFFCFFIFLISGQSRI
jgi:hypothetical protein